MLHVKTKGNIYVTVLKTRQETKGKIMEIHEKIDALIEDGNILTNKIAEELKVSRQQITRWRKGTSEPVATNLKNLCELYQVSADYILGLPKGLSWPREPKDKKEISPKTKQR